MKFAIFTTIFGEAMLIIAIAFPTNGLIPPLRLDEVAGLADVSTKSFNLGLKLNTYSSYLKALATIMRTVASVILSYVSECESELHDITSAINNAGVTVSGTIEGLNSIRPSSGNNDKSTVYTDYKDFANSLEKLDKAIDQFVSLLVINAELTIVVPDLLKVFISSESEALKGATDALKRVNVAVAKIAANLGGNYADPLKATFSSSGLSLAISGCSLAVIYLSNAVAAIVPNVGSAGVATQAVSNTMRTAGEKLSDLYIAISNM